VAATVLVCWLGEDLQSQPPNRVCGPVDVGFDGLAGLTTIVTIVALARARRVRGAGDRESGSGVMPVPPELEIGCRRVAY